MLYATTSTMLYAVALCCLSPESCVLLSHTTYPSTSSWFTCNQRLRLRRHCSLYISSDVTSTGITDVSLTFFILIVALLAVFVIVLMDAAGINYIDNLWLEHYAYVLLLLIVFNRSIIEWWCTCIAIPCTSYPQELTGCTGDSLSHSCLCLSGSHFCFTRMLS